MATEHIVMQGTSFPQRDLDETSLGRFRRFADRFGHLPRLTVAEPDTALLITNNDQRSKPEAPTALHDLGDTIDVNELVDKLAVALIAIPTAISALGTCQRGCPFVRQKFKPPSRAASARALIRP